MPTITESPQLTGIDRRIRRAKRLGYVTTIVAYLLGFFSLAALKSDPEGGSINDLLQLVSQWAWVAGPVFGYLVYSRLLPVGGPIVWLRRFHPGREGRFNFAAALGRAAVGIGHPLTLQDASVPASAFAAGVRLSTLGAYLMVPVVWLLSLGLLFSVGSLLGLGGAALALLVVGGATAGTAMIFLRVLRRLGFRALPSDQGRAVAEVKERMTAAREGRRRIGIGIEVVRCPRVKDLWKAVVRAGLGGASIAIIDVTDMTSNLRFELATALTLLGPERVILTAEADTVSEEQIWLDVCRPAERDSGQHLGRPWLRGALHRYPSTQPGFGPQAKRVADSEMQRLRLVLASRAARPGAPAVRA
jgi:hypothetical protein